MKFVKFALYGVLAIVALGAAAFFALGVVSQGGAAPGLVDGRLAPCPDSPNCVSSEEGTRADAATDPLTVEAWDKLPDAIAAMGGEVTSQSEDYISAEFTSSLFRFVDDVEFRRDEGAVHLRSASRVGYSDAGANAARVAELRKGL